MGKNTQHSDPLSDLSKRRRVQFVDPGVEANECIKIFLVSNEEEVGGSNGFPIDPVDLNQFFDDDGKIYGYQGLKITIWVSLITFHAHADITFQSKYKLHEGGKGITDLKSALESIFADNLIEKRDDFLQTFSSQHIGSILSEGEILQQKASNGHINDSNKNLNSEATHVQVIRMIVGTLQVGELYCRLIPLVLLLVDGSNPIDVDDPSWEIYLVVEKKSDVQGRSEVKILGFSAVYRFYHYPDSSRLRLSQILVLPPYQHKGHGRYLLEAVNSVAVSENVYDLAVEEPLDYFQHVRTCIDTQRLLAFDPIQNSVNSVVSSLKQENLSKKAYIPRFKPPVTIAEEVRKALKINKKQLLQCWDVLIYLGLSPINEYIENYVTFVMNRVKADILEKDSGTGKRVIEVPSDYDSDMSFVMLRSQGGETSSSGGGVEIDENQNNQEEQVMKLVEQRMKEISLIAEKVSMHRA